MTPEIEWVEELPPRRGGRGATIALAGLAQHPGRWAVLRSYLNPRSGGSMVHQLAARYPDYEFAGRSLVNGKPGSVLYGRKKK